MCSSNLPCMQVVSKHCIINGSLQYLNNFQSFRSFSPVSHSISSVAFSPRFIHPDFPYSVYKIDGWFFEHRDLSTGWETTTIYITNSMINCSISYRTDPHRTTLEMFDVSQFTATVPGITTQQ